MEPVCAFLRPLLKRQVNDKYGGNNAAAAHAFGFNRTTFWRLTNGKKVEIGFYDAIKLYEELDLVDDSLLREFYPQEYANYGSSLGTRKSRANEESINFAYSSPLLTEIYLYVFSTGQRSLKDLETEYGRAGRQAMDSLVENSVLRVDNSGCITCAEQPGWQCSKETTQKIARTFIDRVDISIPGSESRPFCIALNYCGIKAVQKILLKALYDVLEIEKKPECRGDTIFIGTFTAGPMVSTGVKLT